MGFFLFRKVHCFKSDRKSIRSWGRVRDESRETMNFSQCRDTLELITAQERSVPSRDSSFGQSSFVFPISSTSVRHTHSISSLEHSLRSLLAPTFHSLWSETFSGTFCIFWIALFGLPATRSRGMLYTFHITRYVNNMYCLRLGYFK